MTVTVNAAFLQEIKEDNRELRRLLLSASNLTSEPANDRSTVKRWVEVLSELRDQLAMHFSLEEAYGYFDDAIDVAPRLSQQAAALRNQHEELFRVICSLVDSAERLLYRETTGKAHKKIARASFSNDERISESRRVGLLLFRSRLELRFANDKKALISHHRFRLIFVRMSTQVT